eukprot:TRINITY_DN3369_c0_g1_i2.p1 TRINITY_DN3369_c0_g1~~TRINITY_DN3369_c0_g1_i2.p1  ORF type:complete len:703 (-),score=75.42 TRINITY_DN3369_c0_g1_i2:64-2172(-)
MPNSDNSFNISPADSAVMVTTPLIEIAPSETINSLSWLDHSPSCIAVGTSSKWLRIYDLRKARSPGRAVYAHSKAILGISCDPFNNEQMATFCDDGIIKLWDLRRFSEPILTLNTNSKGLAQIGWNSIRSGILGSLSKDENVVKFWDLKGYQNFGEGSSDIPVTKRCRTHSAKETLSSFSWHPTNENQLLTLTSIGSVEVTTLNETVPISWSCHGDLATGYGKFVMEGSVFTPNTTGESTSPDICNVMINRAKKGYSLDIQKNLDMSSDDLSPELKRMWVWAHTVSRNNNLHPCNGIRSILFLKIVDSRGQATSPISLPSLAAHSRKSTVFYNSPARKLCLEQCGWSYETDPEAFLKQLEQQRQYDRAAAIAVFHLDIRNAVLSLQRSASVSHEPNFLFVAMGLSADTTDNLWQDSYTQLRSQLENHPYLRASFLFLCSDGLDNYQEILNDTNISLFDRVAFACRYLPDTALREYVEKKMQQTVLSGNLEGLILTGLSGVGADLLEKYVDRTADVQSVALVCSLVPPSLFNDFRATRWVESYRQLLDFWQLWHERALLDIGRREPNRPPKAQVYARCNYCNQSLALSNLLPNKHTDQYRTRTNATQCYQQRVSSCPSCKNPLPHCALCLLPLNCLLPTYSTQTSRAGNYESNPILNNSTSFDNWFTWCHTCRHGGHANHILQWFQTHPNCPVADCSCQCLSL